MSDHPSSDSGPRGRVAVACAILGLITFAAFARTLGNQFVYFDDNYYVYDNPFVSRGLTSDGLKWAFTSVYSYNWHPLTWLSHMLDCQLFGLQPFGHHATSLVLHAVTVVALFLILRRLTDAFWRSGMAAALFAVHPLRVESVAWVAERKDVLSGLLFVLTIGAYARYARRPWWWGNYGLVLVLFALGLMSKPMVVTLPLVLLLLDYWPLQRKESAAKLWAEKLPLFVLSASSCVITLLAQQKGIQSMGPFSLLPRMANALISCKTYLFQMFYPAGLAAFYPYPRAVFRLWQLLPSAVVVGGISWAAVAWRKSRPWLLVGWLWYLIMLVPVIGIIQAGTQAHADRYTYLPQIGICISLVWLVAEWRLNRLALGAILAGALILLGVATFKQTAYWHDSESLWVHTLACTTENETAHFNFGNALEKVGRSDEAIDHYKEALRINPNDADVHNNFGNILLREGKFDEAITHFQKALEARPNYAEAYSNLGMALGRLGRVSEAIEQYRHSVQANPEYATGHFNLAIALNRLGKTDASLAEFRRASQLDPENAKMHNFLANALLRKGEIAEAIEQFRQVLQTEPNDPMTESNLAWLLSTSEDPALRDGNKAVELGERANRSTGGQNPFVLSTLAAAYAETGRFTEAAEAARRGLQWAEANTNLALVSQLQYELKLFQSDNPFHNTANAR